MNITLIGITCAAVTFTVLNSGNPAPPSPPMSAFVDTQTDAVNEALKQLSVQRVNVEINGVLENAVQQLLIGRENLTLILHRPELQMLEAMQHPLNFEFKNTSLPDALDLIVQELSRDREPIDWRLTRDNVIEIGVKSELDRREATLVAYDLREVINTISETANQSYDEAIEEISGLLLSMVEPDNWQENGGNVAQLRFVGGRMFVEAPQRMHERIHWILQQLKDDGAATSLNVPRRQPLQIPSPTEIEEGANNDDETEAIISSLSDDYRHYLATRGPSDELVMYLRKQIEELHSRWGHKH